MLNFNVLSVLLAVLFGLLIYYLIFSLIKVRKVASEAPGPVSLVICAKNELQNLMENLEIWMAQTGVDFELVIVNDHSNDGTEDFLKTASDRYKNLNVINLGEREAGDLPGKKRALVTGIKAARNEIIAVTDADCKPATDDWLRLMVGMLNDQTELVLGYSPYERYPGFLNGLIQYETFNTAALYLSASEIGIPYMGVGRNMVFKKSLFSSFNGYSNKYAGGDDDLFVNEVATKQNTVYQFQPDAWVRSKPKRLFGDWVKQKLRHYGVGVNYKLRNVIFPGMYSLLNTLLIGMLILNEYLWITILAIFVKGFVLRVLLRKFGIQFRLIHILVVDMCFWLLYPFVLVLSLFASKNKW